MTTDQLLKFTEDYKADINKLRWNKEDVRHSFFALHYTTVYDYYINAANYEVVKFIANGKIMFKEEIYHFKEHADRLNEIYQNDTLSFGYHSSAIRNLMFGTWTSFELCISIIYDFVITEDEYTAQIKELNFRLLKAISNLNEENKTVVMEILKKTAFMPLLRKFNFIVKRNPQKYIGDLASDREFLLFTNTLRNCMIHSNGVYHGAKDFAYEFKNTKFEFKNNQIFSQSGNNKDVFFDISKRLKEIFLSVCNCTLDIKFVPYPDDQNIA